ncbi:MAG: hypothetical protein ACO1OG_11945 [Devosia sp.]
MLHFIGILTPREDFPEGDDRQKPFFGPELRVTGEKLFDDEDERDEQRFPRDPADTMLFANLLSPPFL